MLNLSKEIAERIGKVIAHELEGTLVDDLLGRPRPAPPEAVDERFQNLDVTTLAELDRVDLTNMIKGTEPHYSVMKYPLVKKAGRYIGGFVEEWKWDYDFASSLTMDELKRLYLICKYSWDRAGDNVRSEQK